MVGSGVAAAGSPSLTLGAAGVDSAGADSFAGADSLGVLEDSGAACVSGAAFASDPEPASFGAPEVLGWLDSEECADSDSDEPACGDEAGGLSGVWVVAVCAARFTAALASLFLVVAALAVRPGNAWAAASANTPVRTTLPATSMRLIRASRRRASSRTPAWFASFMHRVWSIPLRIR